MEEVQFQDGRFVRPCEFRKDVLIHRSKLGRRGEDGRGSAEERRGVEDEFKRRGGEVSRSSTKQREQGKGRTMNGRGRVEQEWAGTGSDRAAFTGKGRLADRHGERMKGQRVTRYCRFPGMADWGRGTEGPAATSVAKGVERAVIRSRRVEIEWRQCGRNLLLRCGGWLREDPRPLFHKHT
ncbi:unnamed protein product [Linum trigynum]|uniref:Uncharacterized protein n=1 Tax=Linum trigynum TaxID=586398 RepID=A0AAV2CUI8_9ROSI